MEPSNMSDENKFNATDAVKYAVNSNPVEFENEIMKGISALVLDAIDSKRQQIAKTMFSPPEDES